MMLHGLMSAILTPFAGRDALAGLTVLGVVFGMLVLCVYRLVSNPRKIREARKQMAARLYELRLFSDEPAIVWRAQLGLIRGNARYLALMLAPALILAIPGALAFPALDSFYGRDPLPAGQAALVTVQMHADAPLDSVGLTAPDGILIETAPVRVPAVRQVSWRIRPIRPVAGELRVVSQGAVIEKSVRSGDGPQLISQRRVSAARDLIEYPQEPRIAGAPVDWIEVRYPEASVHGVPWWAWMLGASFVTALVLRKRFGVTF